MQVRHPLTLITKETRPLDITVKNTCLLLQDLHSPFTDADEGWLVKRINQKVLMREFDDYFHLLDLIRPNIPRVLEAARQMGIRVAYSCFGYGADESPSLFQEATGWTWNIDGPLGQHPEEWQPGADEVVFSKPGWSALANPKFADFLAENNIANVVIMGAMLDFGVRQTCLELSDRGIQSLIVGDASFGLTDAGHIFTAAAVAHGLVKIRNTGELLLLLEVLKREGSVLI